MLIIGEVLRQNVHLDMQDYLRMVDVKQSQQNQPQSIQQKWFLVQIVNVYQRKLIVIEK